MMLVSTYTLPNKITGVEKEWESDSLLTVDCFRRVMKYKELFQKLVQ
jgi:hypothetical protein